MMPHPTNGHGQAHLQARHLCRRKTHQPRHASRRTRPEPNITLPSRVAAAPKFWDSNAIVIEINGREAQPNHASTYQNSRERPEANNPTTPNKADRQAQRASFTSVLPAERWAPAARPRSSAP